jgi:hypothetical protein
MLAMDFGFLWELLLQPGLGPILLLILPSVLLPAMLLDLVFVINNKLAQPLSLIL